MYKTEKSLHDRKIEAETMRTRYKDRIPIIVEKRRNEIASIDKRKYMAPTDLTMGQMVFVIRRRLKLDASEAIFLFTGNKLVPQNITLQEVYDKECDEDGFLYITYDFENTFGL